jgi:hypothetical protein
MATYAIYTYVVKQEKQEQFMALVKKLDEYMKNSPEIFGVVRKDGILFVESKDKLAEQSLALIPENDRLESLRFHIPAGGTRMPAEFVIDPSGKVDRYIERNRFHKAKS